MLLTDLIAHINATLPPTSAMDGDRIGLQVQSARTEVQSVLTCMEVTDAVVDEAMRVGADCILAFHPLVFMPLTEINEDGRVGRLCTKLIRAGIALVVAHTNFDAYPEGTSTILARKLNMSIDGFLRPDQTDATRGMGVLARPPQALSAAGLLERVEAVCGNPLRYSQGPEMIRRVAILGGSGMSFFTDAARAGVDAFITADVKYHDFHRADGRLMLVDPGHYEMEQFNAEGLASLLRPLADGKNGLKVTVSAVNTNPVCYYRSGNGKQA